MQLSRLPTNSDQWIVIPKRWIHFYILSFHWSLLVARPEPGSSHPWLRGLCG